MLCPYRRHPGRARSTVVHKPPSSLIPIHSSVLLVLLLSEPRECEMEQVVNAVMDVVVPPASMVMLAFAWPTLSLLRGAEWALKSLTKEDMVGKVVVITGASSPIGEHIAYEYARRNANLVLVARREHRLFAVRDNARLLGAGQVLVIAADVVKEDDCRRLVSDTVTYFGQRQSSVSSSSSDKEKTPDNGMLPVNHLVNTVSLGHDFNFEEAGDTAAFPHLMDINFWGNVYPTYAALPYLRRSHGRVVVNASVESWLPMPRMSLYSAAKAAVVDFYETLRYEVKDDVGVTVATHGWVGGDAGCVGKKLTVDEGAAEMQPGGGHVQAYARALVGGACRGDAYVKRPRWYDVFLVFRVLAPDVLAWTFRLLLSTAADSTTPAAARRPPPTALLPAPPLRPLLEYQPAPSTTRVHKLE
ncbi:hypothetical protein HU200_010998 [Digitaria exilis]|uniref:Uncharacterized protein n=1 Tax=Digitaria exilis TaxID=1010633 RepID=A0A835FIF9_9POAL|nr:hypothetical protein HU200_010998 [Digitaria exilis]